MLRPAHICTRCTLHHRLRRHLHRLQQTRRGFSLVSPAQDEAFRYSGETQAIPRDRPQYRDELPPRRQHSDGARPDHDAPRPAPPQGRYSRQPLHPSHLLQDLDAHAPRSNSVPDRPRGWQAKRSRPPDANAPREGEHRPLPASLRQMVAAFSDCGSHGRHDAEAWALLQAIARDMRERRALEVGEELWTLALHNKFKAAGLGFVRRAARRVGQSLGAGEGGAVGQGLPKPSEALRLLEELGVQATDLWARVLWRVASGLATPQLPHYRDETAGEARSIDEGLGELMTLWNMAFATHLGRTKPAQSTLPSPPPSPGTLDWSFLPSSPQLQAMLRGGGKITFAEALDMLLPPIRRNNTVGPTQTELYDYASAAFVTLDTLRQVESVGGESGSYAPFVRLVDGIFRLVNRPLVPEAMKMGVEAEVETEVGGLREVVKRLGLIAGAPRSSVERNKPKGEATEGVVGGASGSEIEQAEQKVEIPLGVLDEIRALLNDGGGGLEPGAVVPDTAAHADFDSLVPPTDDPPSNPERASRDEVTSRFVNLRMVRLGQALQTHNASLAMHIKTEILDFALSAEKPMLPDSLYECLLLTLLTLRKPAEAIEVWQHFTDGLGRKPTAKTYTVMMKGSQLMRDVDGVEGFWKRMRAAGVQADAQAWSVRIFGLVRGQKVDFGLRVLEEMGREWVEAVRAKQAVGKGRGRRGAVVQEMTPAEAAALLEGDVAGVPKPNLAVMNSAISALASRNEHLVPKVLAWGRSFGVEPDLVTYNALLNLSMRRSNADEAVRILHRMQQRGIVADSTTWTVLLSAFLEGAGLDGLAKAEQEKKMLAFIYALEASSAGATIDQKGYALVIDRLLKIYDNAPAASAVLAHMVNKGVEPSTQIYTILMTAYFQREPAPDFAAAEALWGQIEHAHGGRGAALDAVFSDRMIEAYALHHRVVGSRAMLGFLERMEGLGQRPSWRALLRACEALAEREEWGRMIGIVERARGWMGVEGRGSKGAGKAFGERDFWEFVEETGVMGEGWRKGGEGEGVERGIGGFAAWGLGS
ncbi:hypothetical protein LTR08_000088 [Meristemomyces frigidus]|nr:hypothetical protein LTR08_000088 [Meristemomyces frigidus]